MKSDEMNDNKMGHDYLPGYLIAGFIVWCTGINYPDSDLTTILTSISGKSQSSPEWKLKNKKR
jgi:hypothetical protein